jgi:hypothetical protein
VHIGIERVIRGLFVPGTDEREDLEILELLRGAEREGAENVIEDIHDAIVDRACDRIVPTLSDRLHET